MVEKLSERGAGEVIVPRYKEYDLRDRAAIQRLLDNVARGGHGNLGDTILIHLAALAGGIGANRARPAEFFYNNLMMGVPLMHAAWQRGVGKFVALGSISRVSQVHPGAVPRREFVGWLSRRDERAIRTGEEDAAGAGPILPSAIRLQRHLLTAGQLIRPSR